MYEVIKKLRTFPPPLSKYVTASTNSQKENYPPENVLYDNSSYFHSNHSTGTYIEIKFKNYVKFNSVIIQLTKNQDPLHWIIEASKDWTNYKMIYNNSNGDKICDNFVKLPEYPSAGKVYCGNEAIGTFPVPQGIYKSFRIVQTGCSSYNGQYILALRRVDIIGSIVIAYSINKVITANHIIFCILCSIIISVK